MNMQVSDTEHGNNPAELVKSWGFEGSIPESLLSHAANVIKFKNRQVGEIIVGLELASSDAIEIELKKKPVNVRTLDHLRACGFRQVAQRADEILAIQQGYPYLGKEIPALTVHKVLVDSKDRQSLEDECMNLGLVPLQCWDKTILVFSELDKLLLFKGMDKTKKMNSRLLNELRRYSNKSDDPSSNQTDSPILFLGSNQTLLFYRNSLGAGGGENEDTSIQVIQQGDESGNPIMSQIIALLNEAISQECNDIALIPDRDSKCTNVYFRQNQRLIKQSLVLRGEDRDDFIRLLITRAKANPGGGRLMCPVDGNANFSGKSGQAFLRLSFIPCESSQGEAISASVRVLPREAKSIDLEKLNIPKGIIDELNYFVRRKFGLFVVCGPTGSGKSTTIAGMLCEHNNIYGHTLKRISVEQPCERMLPGVSHIDVSQHKYPAKNGRADDGDNFAECLKRILRHDPDVIFVGEVRDKESCGVSVDAANTGHLVLTTTHANEPVLGYRRLASLLPQERHFDLVNVIEGILVQRLVTTVCPHCASDIEWTDEVRDDLRRYAVNKGIKLEDYVLPSTYKQVSKTGCDHCSNTGVSGMVPVHGLLTMNPEVRRCLLSKNEQDWMMAESYSPSKFSLFRSAFNLFESGRIDLDTLML